ncbi:hypothetical protein C7405_107128 [Paraburkholderia caballeronis]|uniref:hypothetical protein n=1 Tax=Paraburkholderia caballeronis TaxID=416943 RepID=UPI001066BFF8|nr:hypothetical protein [Paraburkholderia caballeronis]TDV34729.1 hypothetical protein C7405_107128 [Paraburkholderia caballeronis]
MASPLVSLVLPTSGKEWSVKRCLNSLVHHAPPLLLMKAELIVFLNQDPATPINFDKIQTYLDSIQSRFGKLKVVRSSRFELTAEESAWAASEHAEGEYIWLVGDKRIFFPDGLQKLAEWLENPTAAAAYFNSGWIDQTGLTNNYPSTHLLSMRTLVPFKLFIMCNGLNYMATNMGTWIFERRRLNRDVWQAIIKNCGPHFSHVTAAVAGMADASVQCFSIYICQHEAKAYHAGDDSEWARYSEYTKTYRYYAWTLGLVRQFRFLVDNGIYAYADIRRSMCSEGLLLRRQIDEIYIHVIAQLRFGWFAENQRITQAEFDEIYQFLCLTCPEKTIINEMLREIYSGYGHLPDKDFSARISVAYNALGIDGWSLRFGSLIVGQIGDLYVRLHPRGYLLSPVRDNEDFMVAYKFVDAPAIGPEWQIVSEAEMGTIDFVGSARGYSAVFPVNVMPGKPSSRLSRITGPWVVRFYRHRFAYQLVSRMPSHLKRRLRALLT